nr:hypothetical protein [Candidatus Sigynarchaeota archaeon]
IKTYIEENINALLNPDSISPQQVTTPRQGMNYAPLTDLDFEFPGDSGFNDPSNPANTDQKSMPSNQIGVDQQDPAAFMQDDQGFLGDDLLAQDFQSPAALKNPAVSTGDPRLYNPGIDPRVAPQRRDAFTLGRDGAGASQQFFQRAGQSMSAVPDPRTGVKGNAGGFVDSWNAPARGNYPVNMANQVAQQAMQIRLQKSQEVRTLINQLQVDEQKQASIKETMRNLDAMFELGKVTAHVYFQTHQLFTEKLITLGQEMQELRTQLSSMQYSQASRF